MYHECATEALARDAFSITNEDKFKVLDFHDFRSMAASKGLAYNIKDCKYPGDEKMRKNTRVAKTRRNTTSIKKRNGLLVQNEETQIFKRQRGRPAKDLQIVKRVTKDMYKKAKMSSNRGRLCGDLSQLSFHDCKMEKTGKEQICVVCGETCITRCTACIGQPYMHYQVVRGPCKGKQCFLQYHSSSFFGLAGNDSMLFARSRSAWVPPTESQIRRNRLHIESIKDEINKDRR